MTLFAIGCSLPMVIAASGIERPDVSQTPQHAQQPAQVPDQVLPAPQGKAMLGVIPGEVPQIVRSQLAMNGYPGIVVEQVSPNSPAQQGGLRDMDIILKVGDTPIEGVQSLMDTIASKKPGDRIKIQYLRAGKQQECQVTLAESPVQRQRRNAPHNPRLRIDPGNNLPQPPANADPLDDLSTMFYMMDQLMDDIMADDQLPNKIGRIQDRFNQHRQAFQQKRSLQQQRQSRRQQSVAPSQSGFSFNSSSSINISDEQGTVKISTTQGNTRVLVTDAQGKLLFEGPYNTDEEKNKVPADIRQRIDKVNVNIIGF